MPGTLLPLLRTQQRRGLVWLSLGTVGIFCPFLNRPFQHPPLWSQETEGEPTTGARGGGPSEWQTLLLQLSVASGCWEFISFSVLSMPFYPIILGMPWLIQHDPMTRWAQRRIYLPAAEAGAAPALPPPAMAGGVQGALAAVVGQGSRLVPAGCPRVICWLLGALPPEVMDFCTSLSKSK